MLLLEVAGAEGEGILDARCVIVKSWMGSILTATVRDIRK
jgi:hypothetical protein